MNTLKCLIRRRKNIFAGVAAAVLSVFTTQGAMGQQAQAGRAERKPVLEEIVVTAQKREERLLDVPISASVLRGDDLDKSTLEGLTEELNRVPGVSALNYSLQSAGTQIIVRGVTGGVLFGGSSAVSYYLDSVPFGFVRNAINPDANVYDLDRVEVLRGPQGTLYGANAQAGVLRILTKDANLDEFEFKARGSTFDTKDGDWSYRGDMALNAPLIDGKLAARAVVGYQDLGGWVNKPGDKDINDAEIGSLRFKLNAQPTDELTLGFSAWLSRGYYGAPSTSDDDAQRNVPTTVATTFEESIDNDYDVYSFRLGYDFPAFSITSTTGYINYESASRLDLGVAFPSFFSGIFLFTGLESEVLSEEIYLTSTHGGPWRWTLGAMYRDVEDRLFQFDDTADGVRVFQLDFGQTSESIAVFGELTRLFADGRYELTVGLRYFHDDVGDTENQLTTGGTPPLLEREDTFSALTPRVILTWHPRDESTVYASYSEGFRSGFNQWAFVTRAAPEFPPVEEDTLKNYELGAKGTLWDGRVSFDAALYYMDWQDIKQGRLVFFGDIPISAFINGESASGLGVDFGMTVRPLDALELGASVSWNDLTNDEDEFDAFNNLVVEKGARALGPEWTVGMWADYSFTLGSSGFEGRLSASANYLSALGADAFLPGDSMFTTRASFSIDAPKNWTAMVYVDNLNNEDDRILRYPFLTPDWDIRPRPRTVGLQLEYRY